MSIKIISTNSGQDFSSITPAILVDTDGNYAAISGVAGGTGDITGPGSATADALTIFNGTTGKIVKNSVFTTSGYDLTIPGVLYASGIANLNNITVVDGGGLVSSSANSVINISASSGVIMGGGTGPIGIVTTNSQASMSSSEGTDSAAFSVYPTSATMQQSSGGTEQYISILTSVNNIHTKGNFRPYASGFNTLGLKSFPYSGVIATNLVTQSPNGSWWRLMVDDNGIVSGVAF